MKKNIILGGGGDEDSAKISHDFFVGLLPTDAKVLYIPTAMDPAEHSWPDCLAWVKKALYALPKESIAMQYELENITANYLKGFSGIFIGGGNTFKLLHLMRKTGVDKLLIEFIEKGGVVFGGSAGAIIFGKTIEAAHDPNEVGMTDFSGLNLLEGKTVFCHYTPEKEEEVWGLTKKLDTDYIVVSEESAVYATEYGLKGIGPEAFLFNRDGSKQVIH